MRWWRSHADSFWFWYVSIQVIQGHSGAFSSFLPHVLFSLLLRIITFSLYWSSSRCGSLPKCEIGNLPLVPCLQIWEFSCWLLWGMKEKGDREVAKSGNLYQFPCSHPQALLVSEAEPPCPVAITCSVLRLEWTCELHESLNCHPADSLSTWMRSPWLLIITQACWGVIKRGGHLHLSQHFWEIFMQAEL